MEEVKYARDGFGFDYHATSEVCITSRPDLEGGTIHVEYPENGGQRHLNLTKSQLDQLKILLKYI